MTTPTYDFSEIRNPQLRKTLEDFVAEVFAIADGHDHDGSNSKTLSPEAVVANDSISAAKIQANAVTTEKIIGDAVTTAKILDANITAAKLASDAVTTAKILDANVTAAKIATGAVETAKLAADAVDGTKLADDAVDSEHIAAGAIDPEHLAASAVETAKIANLNVTTAKIAADAIDGTKLADNAVDSEHITAGAIDDAHLAVGAVSATKIGTDAVITAKILDANITAAKLASDSVETAKIKDANVTSAKLAANAQPLTTAVADPGDGQAIAVTNSGTCPLVSGGAETRTLAVPTFAGQKLILACKTYVGDIVITVASAFNQTGNNTITVEAAGDYIELTGIEVGAAKAWRVTANDGCTLTTV